jgi:hypothetical protein
MSIYYTERDVSEKERLAFLHEKDTDSRETIFHDDGTFTVNSYAVWGDDCKNPGRRAGLLESFTFKDFEHYSEWFIDSWGYSVRKIFVMAGLAKNISKKELSWYAIDKSSC